MLFLCKDFLYILFLSSFFSLFFFLFFFGGEGASACLKKRLLDVNMFFVVVDGGWLWCCCFLLRVFLCVCVLFLLSFYLFCSGGFVSVSVFLMLFVVCLFFVCFLFLFLEWEVNCFKYHIQYFKRNFSQLKMVLFRRNIHKEYPQ